MARYSFIGIGTRIFVLILLLVFFVIGGTIWFDYLGLIDAKDILSPVMGIFGLQKRTVIKDIEDPLLLERERLKKQSEAFDMVEADLNKKESDLSTKEKELSQLASQVEDQQKQLEDKENSFNERQKAIENRKVNLEQTSIYLVGMQPQEAVKILLKMDDSDVIDIFRTTEDIAKKQGETSIVSYWLSLMATTPDAEKNIWGADQPERAAALNRKMSRSEGE
jgi:flagellar protein FlbB